MTAPREPETLRVEIVSQPAQKITTTLKVLACIAISMWIVFSTIATIFAATVLNRWQNTLTTPTTPTPAVTGCPFGDGNCGG